jgi:hypothetical protein
VTEAANHPWPLTLHGAAASTPVAFAFNGYLTPGTTYYYRVTATNANGSTQGAIASFTPASFAAALPSPTTPLLVAVDPFEAKLTSSSPPPSEPLTG